MSNRAERRANAKRARRGNSRNTRPQVAKSREGMVDEYSLQEKSIRLRNGQTGEWKPSAATLVPDAEESAHAGYMREPKALRAPHGVRGWLRFLCWALIVLSAIAFLVVMWIPNMPTWSVIVVAAVFAVGVLSLFFVAGNPKDNPNVDANGTAV
ncbi:hypothetical protein [Bifidobacterium simiarum]|uniref:Tripartite tricarboxylate transporter TctB family protein n=1 Tax=Bifidobacterium simiarum TaxID=2045441 RepID=A0A2M9HD57_9BIFI|nr:hypothetical protein [Bifidobacterium simiarum]MBT1166263.1 tripartite tricarboxylate transporter TctB family protein [Bifidobacterium simiarum]PJM74750.1 hypothetical protein CSQ87_08445 [Bifidobacterium simiarum]